MVLAEVPLWVAHGNAAAVGGGGTKAADGSTVLMPTKINNDTRSEHQSSSSVNDPGANNGNGSSAKPVSSTVAEQTAAARDALSLLLSTTRGGGARGRAPLYAVDVHPDGTRFATAAGDGSVKVWSMGGLFAGRPSSSTDGAASEKDGEDNEKRKRRHARRSRCGRFTEDGNFVSSNSEDYYDSTSGSSSGGSSSDERVRREGSGERQKCAMGVNDLSSLVRKKKDGGSGSSKQVTAVNPLVEPPSDAAASTTPANTDVASTAALNDNPPPTKKPSRKQRRQRLLSTITSHEGSVLALRFSPSGRYLATAGDDSYVSIHQRFAAPSLARGNLVGIGADGRGGSAGGDVEHWHRIAVCRGHHLDVVGLAWAPDNSHLVSCSLDSHNPVIVWKLYDTIEGNAPAGAGTAAPAVHNLHPHQTLGRTQHTSTVKGVAFDPAGRYLATAGDDPAICIWRASDDWGVSSKSPSFGVGFVLSHGK